MRNATFCPPSHVEIQFPFNLNHFSVNFQLTNNICNVIFPVHKYEEAWKLLKD